MSVRATLWVLAASLAYVILSYLPAPANITLAPLAAALIVALSTRSATQALVAGAIAGGLALLVLGNTGLPMSLGIMRDAGGPVVPVLVVLYHILTPALLSVGFTLFTARKGGGG